MTQTDPKTPRADREEFQGASGDTMKAIVYTHYGSPDVLQLKEVEKPIPKDDEVLIRIYAASANALDWHYMRGTPFLARLVNGLQKPKNTKLGADVAGRVEAVGRNVTQFQGGDDVFGCIPIHELGSFAEYVCAHEDALALKPAKMTFEQAAAVPLAAFTALQGLRDKGQIKLGQKVLINGASGGVGTFAVQIAKSFGTAVTGVCSTGNVDMVRSLGADQVIDYTQEDFTKNGQRYDLIFDAVGNRSVSDYKRALSPNGICAVAGFTTLPHLFQVIFLGSWVSRTGSKKVGLMETAKPNQKDLVFIKELLEADKVVPVIDRTYPLSEVPEAIRYLEAGHAKGKVVITMEQNNSTWCLTIYKVVMDEARCRATSQLVNGCVAHASRQLLTFHFIYQLLTTLAPTYTVLVVNDLKVRRNQPQCSNFAFKVRSIQKSHGWNRFWSRTLEVKDENLCYLFSSEKCPIA